MAKEDSGHLFSKVVKFVRNPLKDWAGLDAQAPALAPAEGYNSVMLKEMIERRRRDDFVRRREFEMLRKLQLQLQQQGDMAAEITAPPSSFNQSRSPGHSDGRALTLKKIDEIEAQMSQQWWKRSSPAAAPASSSFPLDAEALAAQRRRAYADTVPGNGASLAQPNLASLAATPAESSEPYAAGYASGGGADTVPSADTLPGDDPSHLRVSTSIEEAAICLARGDDAGCEAVLLQTIAVGSPSVDHDDSWRTLLDLYRTTGDLEKFERLRLRYVQRFGRPGPAWISLRALARDTLAGGAPSPGPSGAASVTALAGPMLADGWTSAAVLTRAGLSDLTRVLGAAGPVWQLDWRRLERIDPPALPPLKALFTHWGNSAVQLRFVGATRLLDVLALATPTNERSTPAIWWELRMGVLRAMNQVEDFELVALNYCLTYELSPPPWEDPQCAYTSPDASPVPTSGPRASAPVLALVHRNTIDASGDKAVDHDHSATEPAQLALRLAMLAGNLSGESLQIWQRFDADLVGAGTSVISCAALLRMDFTAAGALLQWVAGRDSKGARVEFIECHRLIAAFFSVIGIADHAIVTLRND